MKVKTSDLSGFALDFAVLLGEYLNGPPDERRFGFRQSGHGLVPRGYHPSSDPLQTYPILQRYKIAVWPTLPEMVEAGFEEWAAICFCDKDSILGGILHLRYTEYKESFGKDILEAGLRAYIVYRFGDEVEVPEEFL
ncbi:MAG: hypothetical protein B7W98_01860 [Parcubacteria group bacterium 20-58-5]|nr:MAG: hypothetical protein B7W98_01860 [Parcubacteria group bacterium 20-58-5]